jgi:cbb3-type cytochrome oxidase subunit 1
LGAIYYIAPRLAGPKRAAPDGLWQGRLAQLHFWLMLAGVGIGYIALLVAGVWQGVELSNPANAFAAVMQGALVALRMSALEPLFLALGTVAFLLNFARLLKGACARCRLERPGGLTQKEGA